MFWEKREGSCKFIAGEFFLEYFPEDESKTVHRIVLPQFLRFFRRFYLDLTIEQRTGIAFRSESEAFSVLDKNSFPSFDLLHSYQPPLLSSSLFLLLSLSRDSHEVNEINAWEARGVLMTGYKFLHEKTRE